MYLYLYKKTQMYYDFVRNESIRDNQFSDYMCDFKSVRIVTFKTSFFLNSMCETINT